MTRLALTLVAILSLTYPLRAEPAYPQTTIHIVLGFSPGSAPDVAARILAEQFRAVWGKPVVVGNMLGAAGNIAADHVAKAAPDGYTVGIIPAGNIAVNPALFPDLPYKASELAPVTMLATVENVLVVNAQTVPARTLKELLELGTKQPGALSYASPGAGSQAHLAGALGKPVWILVSSIQDWRWLLQREDSPWYPTARLFRQDATGAWDCALGRVHAAACAFVAGERR